VHPYLPYKMGMPPPLLVLGIILGEEKKIKRG
jgi:hypothetical protein